MKTNAKVIPITRPASAPVDVRIVEPEQDDPKSFRAVVDIIKRLLRS